MEPALSVRRDTMLITCRVAMGQRREDWVCRIQPYLCGPGRQRQRATFSSVIASISHIRWVGVQPRTCHTGIRPWFDQCRTGADAGRATVDVSTADAGPAERTRA